MDTLPPPFRKRSQPYLWPSWLAEIISGDSNCLRRFSIKTHYTYPKADDGYQNSIYKRRHAKLLHSTRMRLHKAGLNPTVEDENFFRWNLDGKAVLGGKPDIVVETGPGELTVYECKSGKPKNSHYAQAQIYALALSQINRNHRNIRVKSLLVYQDHEKQVPPVDNEFINTFYYWVGELLSPTLLPLSPSKWECRFCDIPNCPRRI